MPRPEQVKLRDLRALRALAHPIRIALIEALAVHGSLTATRAGELLGESPSNCSFHLRQLAKFGMVESAEPIDGRQRPWRIVPGGIGVDPSFEDAESTAAVAVIEDLFIERQSQALRGWSRRMPAEPLPWRQAAFTEFTVEWLTADELKQLERDVFDLFDRYRERRDPMLRPPGSRPVQAHVSAFPADYPAALRTDPED